MVVLVIDILIFKTELVFWNALYLLLDVFLAGSKIFEFTIHSVYRQVLSCSEVVHLLKAFK